MMQENKGYKMGAEIGDRKDEKEKVTKKDGEREEEGKEQ